MNMVCKYCKKGALLAERKLYEDHEGFVGIEVYIEGNTMYVDASSDKYEPNFMECEFEINFCPVCGSKLKPTE